MTGEKIKRLLLKLVIGIFILAVLGIGYCRYAQSSRKGLPSEEIRNGVLQQTWDQLAVSEKNEIVNGWESGSVRLDTLVYDEDSSVRPFYIPDEYIGQEVYIVAFPSCRQDVLGTIKKIVDKDTGEIAGYYYRE